MKNLIIILSILSAGLSAKADPACSALQKFVGSYKEVSETCRGPFGTKMTLMSFSETRENGDVAFTGFMFDSGGLAIGPTTSKDASDVCVVSGESVLVQVCKADSNCMPQNWQYSLSGSHITMTANGCTGEFERE
jgi:hypothetical protein